MLVLAKPGVQIATILSKRNTLRSNDLRVFPWLGLKNLFQTFEELDSVKDKQADIQAVRELLIEDADDS